MTKQTPLERKGNFCDKLMPLMIALEKVAQKRKEKIKSFLVERADKFYHNIPIWAMLIWRASHQSCKGKLLRKRSGGGEEWVGAWW